MSEKRKIRLAIDMDGVCVNLTPYWLDLYFQETGELLKEEELTDFDLFKKVKHPKILDKILLSKRFFSKPQPYKDLMEYFPKLLIDERFEIIILTQIPRNSERAAFEKRMWLKNRFENFDQENFIGAHRKELINCDILLDDNPRHLEQWKNEDRKRLSICMDHSYNKGAQCDYRINNWKEFLVLLNKLWDERLN